MIICSNCSHPYPFAKYLSVANPFTLSCPKCRVSLRAGPYAKRNYIVAFFLICVAAVGINICERLYGWSSRAALVGIMIVAAVLAIVAGLLNWRNGDYRHDPKINKTAG